MCRPWGRMSRSMTNLRLMERGLARPINFPSRGPLPGPAHQIFRAHAVAPPGPSNVKRLGRCPASTIAFVYYPARPITYNQLSSLTGPAYQIYELLGQARPGPWQSYQMFLIGPTGPVAHDKHSYIQCGSDTIVMTWGNHLASACYG